MPLNINEEDLTPDSSVFFRQLDLLSGSDHFKICEVCRAIPFAELPFENELGVPHQPSLAALENSAKSCILCGLILLAALQVREDVDKEYRGIETRRITDICPVVLPSGKAATAFMDPGSYHGNRYYPRVQNSQISSRPGYSFSDSLSVRPWLFGNWWRGTSSATLQLMGLGVRLASTPNVEDAEGNEQKINILPGISLLKLYFHGSYLRVKVMGNSPLAHLIPGRLKVSDSSSGYCLSHIIRWLGACDKNHQCTRLETRLPRRVLDVGLTSQPIRLIETAGEYGKYITLSHCWGASQILTTKRDTIEDRKRGIPIRELPQTFQDVVWIARYIEVQYVWIDSLCIIQDDKHDWEYEASKMGDIYANSYLTVAATFSTDSSGGCFSSWSAREASPHISSEDVLSGKPTIRGAAPIIDTRDYPRSSQLLCRNPFAAIRTSDIPGSTIYVHYGWLPCSTSDKPRSSIIGDSMGLRYDPVKGEPLNTRGWTLQERLLSPRTLHCATEQFFWQCRADFISEEGSRFPNDHFNIDTVVRAQQLPVSERGIHGVESKPLFKNLTLVRAGQGLGTRNGRWNGGWLEIVEDYSGRKLTYGKDKLPALAGLARAILNRTQDEYYAGLWRDHILEDLHWGIAAPENSQHPFAAEDNSVLQTYRAPSWSWASVDGRIRFVPLNLKHAVAEFIHCHTVAAGRDPYGELIGGHIKLWAPLFPISKATALSVDDNSNDLRFNRHDGLVASVPVELRLDCGVSRGQAFFDREENFPCSALFLDPGIALLLKAREPPGEFSRIGIATFQQILRQQEADTVKEKLSPLSLEELVWNLDEYKNRIPRDKEWKGLVNTSGNVSLDVPLGPISFKDGRTFVTIL